MKGTHRAAAAEVAMGDAPTKQGDHFAAVDGLRGLACLMVVAHHCYVHCGKYQWPVFQLAGHTTALSRALFYGNGGVELFFAISGFCLAYPFFSRRSSEPWGRWFTRRAYRILPPYYASALLFWGLFELLHRHPFSLFGMVSPPTGVVPLKGLLVCATLINTYFNPSYWTLTLEARWYLVFPLLMTLLRRSGATRLVLGSLLACGAALWLGSASPRFLLITGQVFAYLPIFAGGMLIARWTAEDAAPKWLVGVAPFGLLASVLLIALTIPSDGTEGPVPALIPWGLLSFFALFSVLHVRRCSRFARTPGLVGVGAFSYSLYLIHEPIVHVAYAMLDQRGLTPRQQFFVYEGLLLPLCVALGYLFYRVAERPLVRRSHWLFKRREVTVLAEPSPLERS